MLSLKLNSGCGFSREPLETHVPTHTKRGDTASSGPPRLRPLLEQRPPPKNDTERGWKDGWWKQSHIICECAASKIIYHKIHRLSHHKSHQLRLMTAGTDLCLHGLRWYTRTEQLSLLALSRCDFLAVIQLNLSSYPTLLKRQTPDATCSHARQLMCLFAWMTPSVWDNMTRATCRGWLPSFSARLLFASGNGTRGFLAITNGS